MRKKYARQIREGVLLARQEVRARRDDDLENFIDAMWAINDLSLLGLDAYRRASLKSWRRLK